MIISESYDMPRKSFSTIHTLLYKHTVVSERFDLASTNGGFSVIQKSRDEHLTVSELLPLLSDRLSELENQIGFQISVTPLGRLKELKDSTTKFLVSAPEGKPRAVIVISRLESPDIVMRGAAIAEEIRGAVGNTLGEAIIKPIDSGYAGGRSYVILPWYREFSSWKPFRVIQKLSLIRPLLNWLREANAMAATAHGHSEDAIRDYGENILHIGKQKFCTGEVSAAIKKTINRLESGQWNPRHTIDHNDFWMGNVMLKPGNSYSSENRYAYTIIDWNGANEKGYGIYDLIRLARSLNLSDRIIRREFFSHSNALGCNPEDIQGHLLASLGRLHQNIECFPENRYIQVFQTCWETLVRALPEARQL